MKSVCVTVVLVLLIVAAGSPTSAAQSPAQSPASVSPPTGPQPTAPPRQPPTSISTPSAGGTSLPGPTAGPPYKLDVAGDANITGTYRVNGVPISATANWTQAANNIYYTTGNVGIGTPTPAHALQVNGTTLLGAPGGVYGFSIGAPAPGPYPSLGFNTSYDAGLGYLAGVAGYGGIFQFQDGDGKLLYYSTAVITPAGAEHTFTPTFTIDRVGNAGIAGKAVIGTDLPATGGPMLLVERFEAGGGLISVFRVNARFGINGIGMDVNNNGDTTIGGHVLPGSDNARNLGSGTNRWGAVYAANGTIQTSDARLKKAVTPLGYGLREVLQLRPVTFQWKDRLDERTHLGLIAQDVDAIIPEVVERDTDSAVPIGMSYTSLVPVVIKAIQEQQDIITALKAVNASLDARIRALEQALARSRGQQ